MIYLTNMIEKSNKEMGPKQVLIPIINAFPGMHPEMLETMAIGASALILVVQATGGSASNLNETIKKLTEKNIPVFLVAEKPGNDFGITRIVDQTQIESSKAGAIRIEKLNYKDITKITQIIQEKIKEGKTGKELGQAVYDAFSYKEGEEKPTPEWENNNTK